MQEVRQNPRWHQRRCKKILSLATAIILSSGCQSESMASPPPATPETLPTFSLSDKGVTADQIEAIACDGYVSYVPSYRYVSRTRVFLKNGWMGTDYGGDLITLDFDQHRKENPGHWQRWKKSDGRYYYENNDGKWVKIDATAGTPGRKGERLSRSVEFLSSTTYGTVSTIESSSFYLGRNGRFESASSNSMFNQLSYGNYAYSKRSSSKSGKTRVTTANVNDSEANHRGSGSITKSQAGSGDHSGEYYVDGHTIEYKFDNGEQKREVFGFCRKDRQRLSIGGTVYRFNPPAIWEDLERSKWELRIRDDDTFYYTPRGETFERFFVEQIAIAYKPDNLKMWVREMMALDYQKNGKPLQEQFITENDNIVSYVTVRRDKQDIQWGDNYTAYVSSSGLVRLIKVRMDNPDSFKKHQTVLRHVAEKMLK